MYLCDRGCRVPQESAQWTAAHRAMERWSLQKVFEATFRIAALVESDEQGQMVFHVKKQENPVDQTQLSSLLATLYQQDVSTRLQPGDNLTFMVGHSLPPREVERNVLVRSDQLYEEEGVKQPIQDLLLVMRAWYEPMMLQVVPGDILTITFRLERP
jgi:hypothetical protein